MQPNGRCKSNPLKHINILSGFEVHVNPRCKWGHSFSTLQAVICVYIFVVCLDIHC